MWAVLCAILELLRVQQWTKPVMIGAVCSPGGLELQDFLCKSPITFYSEGVLHVNCFAHSVSVVEIWGRDTWRAGRACQRPKKPSE